MREDDQRGTSHDIWTNIAVVSLSRLSPFRDRYAAFCTQIASQQENARHLTKAKWVVRDRQGFNSLIKNLRDSVESLHRLVPVTPVLARLLVKEEI